MKGEDGPISELCFRLDTYKTASLERNLAEVNAISHWNELMK